MRNKLFADINKSSTIYCITHERKFVELYTRIRTDECVRIEGLAPMQVRFPIHSVAGMHFAERTFCRRIFCRTDILTNGILQNGQFAENRDIF